MEQSPEQNASALNEIMQPTPRLETTKDQVADYLISIGDAHRDLWIRRLKKGMKPTLLTRFNALVAAHAAELAAGAQLSKSLAATEETQT